MELTADPTETHGVAVGVVGDAPRLPEAAPAPTPPPAPDPAIDAANVELDEPPAPETSRTPVGFFVLMMLIVGAITVIGAIARPWESSPQDPAPVTVDEPAPTTPSTVPATTQPAPTTTAAAAIPTTTLVVAPLPPPETDTPVGEGADAGPFDAAVEACQTEQRTISVAIAAYEIATGEPPADPDALVAGGMLDDDLDGWSTRWTFGQGTPGLTVVPVAGGPCDL